MKKMLKIMAMLLVIATVIFAAGCAEKKEGTGAEKNATSAPGELSGKNKLSENATNVTTPTEEGNVTKPSENVTNVTKPTENVTTNVTGNVIETEEDADTTNETPTEDGNPTTGE
jgi:hypothetical protein